MIAGLGKNGQIVSVSPSRGLVVVRMGNPPQSSGSEIPSQLCDQIWQKLNEVMCSAGYPDENNPGGVRLRIFPNPAHQFFMVELSKQHFGFTISDLSGRLIAEGNSIFDKIEVDCRKFPQGIYFVRVITDNQIVYNQRVVVIRTP
jgi:hypothetical protein